MEQIKTFFEDFNVKSIFLNEMTTESFLAKAAKIQTSDKIERKKEILHLFVKMHGRMYVENAERYTMKEKDPIAYELLDRGLKFTNFSYDQEKNCLEYNLREEDVKRSGRLRAIPESEIKKRLTREEKFRFAMGGEQGRLEIYVELLKRIVQTTLDKERFEQSFLRKLPNLIEKEIKKIEQDSDVSAY